jgi:hypothetical protein
VLAGLRMGLVIDPERGPFGGVPQALRPDRGLEFAAEALATATAVLGIRLLPAPAYSPHLKGKVERLGRSIAQDLLCMLPFYTDGPRDAAGRLYGPADGPLTLARFAAEFRDWVAHYNLERPHGALGAHTPLDRWQADATPLRSIPDEELRFLLLAGQTRTIGKDGIHFGGLTFVTPELNGRVGQAVLVRFIDSHFGHGNFRNWAAFTHSAQTLCQQTGSRTRVAVKAVGSSRSYRHVATLLLVCSRWDGAIFIGPTCLYSRSLKPSRRAPARNKSSTAQHILRQLVSPGKRPRSSQPSCDSRWPRRTLSSTRLPSVVYPQTTSTPSF